MNRTQSDSPMVVVDRQAWEDALDFFAFVANGTYGGDDSFDNVVIDSADQWVSDHGTPLGIISKKAPK